MKATDFISIALVFAMMTFKHLAVVLSYYSDYKNHVKITVGRIMLTSFLLSLLSILALLSFIDYSNLPQHTVNAIVLSMSLEVVVSTAASFLFLARSRAGNKASLSGD